MSDLICGGCGKTIVGRYIQALDKIWHPDCFVCAGCGGPFTTASFAVRDDQPYHEACYQERFGTRCGVCGEYIEGQYVETFWGETYCLRHRDQYPMCYACQRPVSRRLTGGGVRYNDGRVMCNLCRAQAVDDLAEVQAILRDVQARLARYGVDTRDVTPPVQMVALTQLIEGEESPFRARMRGRTETQIETRNGREVSRRVEVVYVLGGLPREHLVGVLAHELGHVWLFRQRADGLPSDLEEGLCNLLAYLLHREHDTTEARYCARAIAEDDHPDYGDGFRRALAWYQQAGLAPVLQAVVDQRRWGDAFLY